MKTAQPIATPSSRQPPQEERAIFVRRSSLDPRQCEEAQVGCFAD
jgi:hypothetical protein